MSSSTIVPVNVAHEFVTVTETTLPNGTVVPSFKVGKYLSGRENDQLAINASASPWVKINYYNAKAEAKKAGLALITELQYLALAHNIASVAVNWISGVVGEGCLFQGLRKGTVNQSQPGEYVSKDEDERRWFELSNGELIWDAAGNAFAWVFDNIQGDENGIVAHAFAADSPSITTTPAPSSEKGVGWYPKFGSDWSGRALFRGGYWGSRDVAGVFSLNYFFPGRRVLPHRLPLHTSLIQIYYTGHWSRRSCDQVIALCTPP